VGGEWGDAEEKGKTHHPKLFATYEAKAHRIRRNPNWLQGWM